MNKLQEQINDRASLKDLQRVNSKFIDYTLCNDFEFLKRSLIQYATNIDLQEVKNDIKRIKVLQNNNAKVDQVEKDIKAAKDCIYISLKKYIK